MIYTAVVLMTTAGQCRALLPTPTIQQDPRGNPAVKVKKRGRDTGDTITHCYYLNCRGHGCEVVRLLASHLGEQGSVPGGVEPGFSRVGLVPDDAAGLRVFPEISRFPPFFHFAEESGLPVEQCARPYNIRNSLKKCISFVTLQKYFSVLYLYTFQRAELASHLDEPGSIPGWVDPGFSNVGLMPDDAADWRVFSGSPISPALSFQLCSILSSLHHHRISSPRRRETKSPPLNAILRQKASVFDVRFAMFVISVKQLENIFRYAKRYWLRIVSVASCRNVLLNVLVRHAMRRLGKVLLLLCFTHLSYGRYLSIISCIELVIFRGENTKENALPHQKSAEVMCFFVVRSLSWPMKCADEQEGEEITFEMVRGDEKDTLQEDGVLEKEEGTTKDEALKLMSEPAAAVAGQRAPATVAGAADCGQTSLKVVSERRYEAGPPTNLDLQQLDKIYFKRMYTEVAFLIGSDFIRHILDDSPPIADLQGNKKRIPYWLDSTVLCILEPQLYVHWLLLQRVASVTPYLAVWDSLRVSLQVCYWLRGIQGMFSKPRSNYKGIVSDDATGRRVFSGIFHFPRPFIRPLLHTNLSHPRRLSAGNSLRKYKTKIRMYKFVDINSPLVVYSVTEDGDDWTSVLQVVSNTVCTNG
ncbi:hypothetical protein PR048_017475 [Dryococelus australis]|uniref:Uncharacterized protein n=1 Tax=Dryococelus australis TaxID=614101 RepID=A0ABQ9H9P2_9NEOP|nr:hypothetical protein PR048_017475 [Dryococelus australis]